MKKLLSIVLALAFMLSLGVSAFAEVKVDKVSQTPDPQTGTVTVDNANLVFANASGDQLAVRNDVNNTEFLPPAALALVDASNAAQIEIGDSVVGNGDNGINARNAGTTVTVGGEVSNSEGGYAIKAAESATVTVEGDVTEADTGNAINATGGATTVTVKGDVTESGDGDAVIAEGATVEVGGNVTESGEGDAIKAADGATVTVEGDVTEADTGNAINATGGAATVTIEGNVTESGEGNAIYAEDGATVVVGGDVSQSDDGYAIKVSKGATIIVEGAVTGFIDAGSSAADCVYMGQLQNGMITTYDGNNVHYLIGLAADSELTFEDVSMSGDEIIEPSKTVKGIEKSYLYTKTVDGNDLAGKSVTMKPSAEGKVLSVSGLGDSKVDCVPNADGTVTLTIQSRFNGGLQNLVLKLVEKPGPNPGQDPNFYYPAPVYYVVPVGTATVPELALPDSVEEGLITKLESADHAGLTFDKSLAAEVERSIKVTLNGEEIPAEAYSFRTGSDGRLSLILSNTYLFSLGNGSYDFVATVGELEIPFTVAVAK